ncbi:dihydrolipoyl dehydrogenase [Desulforamulus ruminis]|uniref:Dihydrolipoyl dehydrogenase n=1 Tax=Desulforamulus ruminis (strain ATCC 23193 / DSM 2154 / NCIMB 8452 / DL) TaxID=696281 RepID=F6DSE9_DESRL|nr:dihydrolipoyl dehydrogenase [Desulforamulus ruminis]AEG59928.1 dihydrolipoamide dehydrogenase [Desulforamulus ruminis DSM 2154]
MTYNAVVIGGGPGGYVAAIRIAQLGGKVALVEKDQLGGTCLNRGCIPTKSLIAAVDKLKGVEEAAAFGIAVNQPVVDFNKVQGRKEEVVEKLVSGIQFLLNKNKVDFFKGAAKIKAPGVVEVAGDGETKVLQCENMVIATGSSPALIKSLGYNGTSIITSEEALQLQEIPKSLLIIGAGVIGCEFAHIYGSLGTEITMVEAAPSILSLQDKDISRRMQTIFKKKKVTIKTNGCIKKITEVDGGIQAELENGERLTAEKALISIGRVLNTHNLGLSKAGVALGEKGQILVNDQMQTNIKGIYAIGDVVMKYQLAHVASAQGVIAAENIMGKEAVMDYRAVPSCVFTSPEIASVGMTEQQVKDKGLPVKTGKFNFMANGKALSMGEGDGFVKVVTHAETDRILGVHIIGPHASDLIAEATLAVQKGLTAKELAGVIHAHPTLAEALMEAAENVHGLSIHG